MTSAGQLASAAEKPSDAAAVQGALACVRLCVAEPADTLAQGQPDAAARRAATQSAAFYTRTLKVRLVGLVSWLLRVCGLDTVIRCQFLESSGSCASSGRVGIVHGSLCSICAACVQTQRRCDLRSCVCSRAFANVWFMFADDAAAAASACASAVLAAAGPLLKGDSAAAAENAVLCIGATAACLPFGSVTELIAVVTDVLNKPTHDAAQCAAGVYRCVGEC